MTWKKRERGAAAHFEVDRQKWQLALRQHRHCQTKWKKSKIVHITESLSTRKFVISTSKHKIRYATFQKHSSDGILNLIDFPLFSFFVHLLMLQEPVIFIKFLIQSSLCTLVSHEGWHTYLITYTCIILNDKRLNWRRWHYYIVVLSDTTKLQILGRSTIIYGVRCTV